MEKLKFKKLSSVESEETFNSDRSQHLIVEDGGNIRRLNAKERILPKATSEDKNKIIRVADDGNYFLSYEQVAMADATLIIG